MFDIAMNAVLKWEGGLSKDPADPGGTTKYGISLRAYPQLGEEGIINLTKAQAKELYRKDYWERIPERLRMYFPRLSILLFDSYVNQGATTANKCLQRACGANPDGKVGRQTMLFCSSLSENELIDKFVIERGKHYQSLKTFARFGKGWMNRLNDMHKLVLSLITA